MFYDDYCKKWILPELNPELFNVVKDNKLFDNVNDKINF